jgi:hypothetical protein
MVPMPTADDAGPLVCRLEIPRSFLGSLFTRRPTAVEVRDKGLVVYTGSRLEVFEWAAVRGVEQIIVGMDPMYAVFIQGRPRTVVGSCERTLPFIHDLVRIGGLRWIHEPFSAAR